MFRNLANTVRAAASDALTPSGKALFVNIENALAQLASQPEHKDEPAIPAFIQLLQIARTSSGVGLYRQSEKITELLEILDKGTDSGLPTVVNASTDKMAEVFLNFEAELARTNRENFLHWANRPLQEKVKQDSNLEMHQFMDAVIKKIKLDREIYRYSQLPKINWVDHSLALGQLLREGKFDEHQQAAKEFITLIKKQNPLIYAREYGNKIQFKRNFSDELGSAFNAEIQYAANNNLDPNTCVIYGYLINEVQFSKARVDQYNHSCQALLEKIRLSLTTLKKDDAELASAIIKKIDSRIRANDKFLVLTDIDHFIENTIAETTLGPLYQLLINTRIEITNQLMGFKVEYDYYLYLLSTLLSEQLNEARVSENVEEVDSDQALDSDIDYDAPTAPPSPYTSDDEAEIGQDENLIELEEIKDTAQTESPEKQNLPDQAAVLRNYLAALKKHLEDKKIYSDKRANFFGKLFKPFGLTAKHLKDKVALLRSIDAINTQLNTPEPNIQACTSNLHNAIDTFIGTINSRHSPHPKSRYFRAIRQYLEEHPIPEAPNASSTPSSKP